MTADVRAIADKARDASFYYSHHVGDDPAALAYCQGVEHVLRYITGDAGATPELRRGGRGWAPDPHPIGGTMAIRICRTREQLADAHKANGRRLMVAATDCYGDGFAEAGDVLRALSRMEYARAWTSLQQPSAA